MKVFISHKQEDAIPANRIAHELSSMGVAYYLDLLDNTITKNGKDLTEHIKNNLNKCTDIIVVMSEATLHSQWVPFEVGMSAQKDMPTATYLERSVPLPEFLQYWPRLKTPGDICKYVLMKRKVESEAIHKRLFESATFRSQESQTAEFYAALKKVL